VLARLFAEEVKISAAGRTDAGVHAAGQVVSFTSARDFPVERLISALNGNLPADLRAVEAAVVRDDFSARFDALARIYEYRILNRPAPSALLRHVAHHVYHPLDLARMRAAAADLIGQHDFVAFCGVLPEKGGTVRTVHAVEIRTSGDDVRVRIEGQGFLHRMVRISVGTLVEIATGRRAVDDIPLIIASRDRRNAGYTAPANGLTLVGVRYADFCSERPAV
jgi:tRNA pseudouridine38-40 synthase